MGLKLGLKLASSPYVWEASWPLMGPDQILCNQDGFPHAANGLLHRPSEFRFERAFILMLLS